MLQGLDTPAGAERGIEGPIREEADDLESVTLTKSRGEDLAVRLNCSGIASIPDGQAIAPHGR